MTPQPEPSARLLRFDRVERAVHWSIAVLVLVLLATGASMYFEPLALFIGRRKLVETIHLYSGLALPVPVLAALAGRWGKGLRADLGRFNRWSSEDRAWLRSVLSSWEQRQRRRQDLVVGKFNAGQKLNAAFVGGMIVVMLATGAIMKWYSPWPLPWRTGATFVHDWLALAVFVVVVGHIGFALRDRDALRAMVRGTIRRAWARRHAPGWLAEQDASPGPERAPDVETVSSTGR